MSQGSASPDCVERRCGEGRGTCANTIGEGVRKLSSSDKLLVDDIRDKWGEGMASGERVGSSIGLQAVDAFDSAVSERKGSETRDEDRDDEPCNRTSTVTPVWPSRVGGGRLSDTPLTGVAANRPEFVKRKPAGVDNLRLST